MRVVHDRERQRTTTKVASRKLKQDNASSASAVNDKSIEKQSTSERKAALALL